MTNPMIKRVADASSWTKALLVAPTSWWRGYFWPLWAVWLVYYACDLPHAHIDDLFYAGSAVCHAQTGVLWNTLGEGFLAANKMYPYPPLHPLALSYWLQLFGISAHSIMAFQATIGLLTCWLLGGIFVRWKIPLLYAYAVFTAYIGCVADLGFKPNAFAMFLLVLGLALLWQRKWWAATGGYGAICLAVLSVPYMVFSAIALTLGVLAAEWVLAEKGRKFWVIFGQLGCCGLGIALAGGLFLISIHFDLFRWFGEYYKLVKIMPNPMGENWKGGVIFIAGQTVNGWNPVIFGGIMVWCFAVMLFQLFFCRSLSPFSGICLGAFFLLICLNFLYPFQVLYFGPWFFLAYASLSFALFFPRVASRPLFCGIVLGILFLSQSLNLCKILFQKVHSRAEHQQLVALAKSEAIKKVYFDSPIWRYVFDCQIEPKYVAAVLAFPFNKYHQGHLQSLSQLSPQDGLFMSTTYFRDTLPETHVLVEPMRAWGKQFNSIPEWKDEVFPEIFNGHSLDPAPFVVP